MIETMPNHRLALVGIAAMVLQRAVEDAALGIRHGLLDAQTLRPRRKAKMTGINGASNNQATNPLEMFCLEAAELLLDWRAQRLCDVISTLSPRSPICPDFLRRRAAHIALHPPDNARNLADTGAGRIATILNDGDSNPTLNPDAHA